VTELAALAGQPGLFGEAPPPGAKRPKAPPPPELGKRRTKRPASYADAGDLDSFLDGDGASDGEEDGAAGAVDDADMEEEVMGASSLSPTRRKAVDSFRRRPQFLPGRRRLLG